MASYEAAFRKLISRVDGLDRESWGWPEWAITTVIDTRSYWSTAWQAISCHESQVTAYQRLKDLSSISRLRSLSQKRSLSRGAWPR